MDSYKYKFSNKKERDFFRKLNSSVHDYFKTNNIDKYGNTNMVFKSIFMFTLYFAPLILLLTGVITNILPFFAMWILMGLGKAGIGMGVMHDANHGSYSKNPKVNKMLSYTMNLIGANSKIWNIQHNILHHTYTNIYGADEDIIAPFLLRFSPYPKKLFIHRFQHLYVWFMYSLTTINWVTSRNFQQAFKFHKMGIIKSKKELIKDLFSIMMWKVIYFGYILVLPIILTDFSPLLIIAGFVSMHLVTGLILSTIFQTAHVMPTTEYPEPNEKRYIDNSWFVHQMETTTNFGSKSRIFEWLIGGLDYQVEHHLFQNICHVHYRKIAEITSEIAEEFNIRYNTQKNFFSAVRNHGRMLKQLGRS